MPAPRFPPSIMSQFFEDHPMMLFGLEAGVALFLLIFIVIWTMSGAKKHPRPLRAPPDHPSRQGEGANDTPHAAPPGSTGTAPEHSQPPKPDAP
nr:hypothetical protein RSP673_02700 [Ralstonia solanacearum P673]